MFQVHSSIPPGLRQLVPLSAPSTMRSCGVLSCFGRESMKMITCYCRDGYVRGALYYDKASVRV